MIIGKNHTNYNTICTCMRQKSKHICFSKKSLQKQSLTHVMYMYVLSSIISALQIGQIKSNEKELKKK